MNGENVDVEFHICSHNHSHCLNIPKYLQGKFKLISTIIRKGHFNLYAIKKIKYQTVKYLVVELYHYVDTFNICHLNYFFEFLGKDGDCVDWAKNYTRITSISYIKNIRMGCEYLCYVGSVIELELNYYYDGYFNEVSRKFGK